MLDYCLLAPHTYLPLTSSHRSHSCRPRPCQPNLTRPLDKDVFDLIEAHFQARAAECALAGRLEARAQQFRSVQKRLLARFKVGMSSMNLGSKYPGPHCSPLSVTRL